ncbi:hypothetical protein COY32_02030 [candidate division WWE3 bacterium CG_4_10_14_0_2_um_filter_41_14]|uniref:Glycosyl transferase family 1 domain-containing protein n=1 Tax=candidate division WWE3 bacterium CG_4_10_14_0_2_um_filter_41_14 TaxID=1975072 RepID=A0A2M7TKD8_UNCKA|nr:MAG: hypothetical protein COY32_02030 [candidate division WWE3 bacterium CG_4_10_14_0_2_um_filter_41_14]
MKILLVSAFFHPHTGGAEMYAQELLSSIESSHPDVIIDVLTHNTNKSQNFETFQRFEITRVPALAIIPDQFYLSHPISLIKTLFRLAKNDYDVVITQTRFFEPTWWVWLFARIIKAKSVFIGHGTGFVSHESKLVRVISRFIDKTISAWSVKRYDKVIVISSQTQQFFEKTLKVTNTTLIPGGINTQLFTGSSERENTRPLVISYIGRLIEAKGLFLLYDAVKNLLKDKSLTRDIKLNIAGSGPIYNELRSRIAKDNLQNSIKMHGHITYESVPALLKNTHIFINPSFNEGLPRNVLEASASGCIVIATDVGSTRDIIDSFGILIKPHSVEAIMNAIKKVDNDFDRFQSQGKNLKQYVVDTFDWNSISEKVYILISNQ